MRNLSSILSVWLLILSGLQAAKPLNILFFTADDMNHDSASIFGGPIRDLTPHIDKLAAEGIRFDHAYSTVAVCQPVRQTMFCGLYPHRSGSMGFFPVKPGVRTLNQQLRDAGYLITCYGKNKHLQPSDQFCADIRDDTISRHPSKLANATRTVLRQAKAQEKPFFHNINCYDPHRPFIGMKGPKDLAEGEAPSRWIKTEEVTSIPGFLEDLPEIRRELAGYYTSVRRLDDALGAVLAVIREEGFENDTLVFFYGGDHGMSFPFAKSNSYENSTRGALVIRWPGVIQPGTKDVAHMVTTLDFAPTLLEAAGLPALPDIDGRSFLPALKGRTLEGWDHVFVQYNAAFGNRWMPMRCIRTREHSYIWNAWSNGRNTYQAENMAGLTWKAMLQAAEENPSIGKRTALYSKRVPEEFYDLTKDPCERDNLISDARHAELIASLRKHLLGQMQQTADPLAQAFAHRDDATLVATAINQLKKQFEMPRSHAIPTK